MKVNKTAQRLLTFFIGIPVIVGCAAISFCNHLLLHIAILVTTTLISFELHGILSKSLETQNKALTIILADLIPLSTSICVIFGFSLIYAVLSIMISLLLVFTLEIWGYNRTTRTFEKSIQKLGSSLIIVIFCGFFMSFISRMAAFPEPSAIVSMFLLFIFGCDSCAWFFGITMGKNNRGFVAASPNKSVMGFIGGYVGSFIAVFVALLVFPVLRSFDFWKIALLSVTTATTAILGDLVESVMKRSSNTKDSGNIIPGRGGLLDSADSIVFSAPIFYFLVKLLLGM